MFKPFVDFANFSPQLMHVFHKLTQNLFRVVFLSTLNFSFNFFCLTVQFVSNFWQADAFESFC